MSNSDFYDIVNVGSSRLATDGECIRDAFIKINNNSSTVFNTVLDYDTNVLFGGWKLVVGVDNSIVVSNSINVSNSVGVNIATMVANTNNIDLDFNIENNLNLSINNGGITLISDASNNVVLTANSFTSTNVIYAPSLTNTTNTNNITFNANDIDITNTFGDININAVTNDINFTGDIVMNTNMFDINVTTGDINIQNGAITIDNSQEVNIGINNNLIIDNSNNITFSPTTNIDFSNVVDIDLDFNLINQINIDFENIVNNEILIFNSNTLKFESSPSPDLTVNKLTVNKGVIESTTPLEGAGSVVVHDTSNSHIFTHTQLSGNFTANFTGIELAANQATALTLVLTQGSPAYIPNAVQINGVAKTISWQSGGAPAGTPNGVDAVTFSVLYDGTNYTILGNLISHS